MSERHATSKRPRKMARLPKDFKVEKRPLLRPPIPSPYTSDQKIVYVSSKTPFMSAVKRVQKLLSHAEKRQTQSAADTIRSSKRARYGAGADDDINDIDRVAATLAQKRGDSDDEVVLKATGKAITKALELALWFQQRREYGVRITTGSVGAIDDIVAPDDQEMVDAAAKEEQEDVPETRIRYASTIQVAVSTK